MTIGKMPFDPPRNLSLKPKNYFSILEIKITLSEPDYENISDNLKILI